MRIVSIICITFAAISWTASEVAADTLKNGEFTCISAQQGKISASLANLMFEENELRINNFLLSIGSNSKIGLLELVASAINRSDTKRIIVSVELVGFDTQNELFFAISAGPPFGTVAASKIAEIHGNAYLLSPAKPLPVNKVCIRVTAASAE